jgi:hypothetical protein
MGTRHRVTETARMPTPRSLDIREIAITAALYSVYAGARGTARALSVVALLTR